MRESVHECVCRRPALHPSGPAFEHLGIDERTFLSVLWIFVMLNYVYADVIGLMDPVLLRQYLTGKVDGLELSQGFLFWAAVLMELPIAMVLLSRVLPYRANRWINVVAGIVKTSAVVASLFVGTPTKYYLFFATIEVACTSYIVWFAWRWREPRRSTAA